MATRDWRSTSIKKLLELQLWEVILAIQTTPTAMLGMIFAETQEVMLLYKYFLVIHCHFSVLECCFPIIQFWLILRKQWKVSLQILYIIKGQLHSFEKPVFEIRATACYSPGLRNCCFLQSCSHRHLLLGPTLKSRCMWEGSEEWLEYPEWRKAWFCIGLGRKVGLFMQPVTFLEHFPG